MTGGKVQGSGRARNFFQLRPRVEPQKHGFGGIFFRRFFTRRSNVQVGFFVIYSIRPREVGWGRGAIADRAERHGAMMTRQ